MKHALVTVVLLFAVAIGNVAVAGNVSRVKTHLKDEYIVVLHDDADLDAAAARFSKLHGAKVKSSCRALMKSLTVVGSDAMARAIADDSEVSYVAENGTGVGATVVQSPAPSIGLDRIDQAIMPLSNSYAYAYTGQSVVVYVLDSGVNPIGDLAGRVVRNINFMTDAVSGRDPNNFADCYGHGTPVADIIGGTVYGVAKNVRIVNVRIINCANSFDTSDYRDAMDWIVTDHQNHPFETTALVNISAGSFVVDPVIDDATMRVLSLGLPVVVSSGNDSADACGKSPARLGNPSSYPNNPNQFSTITVGGIREDDSFNSFLNYGPCVDILAPSVNLTAMSKYGTPQTFGGSSGAAPHVTGVGALRMEQFGALSPGALEGSIKDNSTPNVITGVPAGTPNLLLYSFTVKRRICCS